MFVVQGSQTDKLAPLTTLASLVTVSAAFVANVPLLEDPQVVPQANIVSEDRPLKASSKFVKPKSLMDMLVVPMEMYAALATVLTEYVVNARLPALPLVVLTTNVVLQRPLISPRNFWYVDPHRLLERFAKMEPTAALVIVFQALVVSNTVANVQPPAAMLVVPQAKFALQ